MPHPSTSTDVHAGSRPGDGARLEASRGITLFCSRQTRRPQPSEFAAAPWGASITLPRGKNDHRAWTNWRGEPEAGAAQSMAGRSTIEQVARVVGGFGTFAVRLCHLRSAAPADARPRPVVCLRGAREGACAACKAYDIVHKTRFREKQGRCERRAAVAVSENRALAAERGANWQGAGVLSAIIRPVPGFPVCHSTVLVTCVG